MKTTFETKIKTVAIISLMLFYSCYNGNHSNNYDPDLLSPDGNGGGYNYTQLGVLVSGTWALDTTLNGYNRKLYINNKEVASTGVLFTNLQKDLVFQLNKDKSINYWRSSEIGSLTDTLFSNGTKTLTTHPPKGNQLKKIYTTGYWKFNLKDSTVLIHFGNPNIPELKFKYASLNNTVSSFQEISHFDSVVNGEKVSIEEINTYPYHSLHPRF